MSTSSEQSSTNKNLNFKRMLNARSIAFIGATLFDGYFHSPNRYWLRPQPLGFLILSSRSRTEEAVCTIILSESYIQNS